MNIYKIGFLVFNFLYIAGQPLAAEMQDPRDLLNSTIEALREHVLSDQVLIASDPGHAMLLVEKHVSPHVDMRLASRLVLGKHWNGATATQRDGFVDSLRRMLLRIFAVHIRDFSSAEVRYSPTEYKGQDNRRAVVRTQVIREGLPEVTVDYRFYRADEQWKVYDIGIFGISLIKTYHLTLKADLKALGIDAVIEQINAKTLSPNAAAVSMAKTAALGQPLNKS